MSSLTKTQLAYIGLLEISNQHLRSRVNELESLLNLIMLYCLLKDHVLMTFHEVRIKGKKYNISGDISFDGTFKVRQKANLTDLEEFSHYDPQDPTLPSELIGAELLTDYGTYSVHACRWIKGVLIGECMTFESFSETYGYLPKVETKFVSYIKKAFTVEETDEGFCAGKGLWVCMNNPLEWVDLTTLRIEGGIVPKIDSHI